MPEPLPRRDTSERRPVRGWTIELTQYGDGVGYYAVLRGHGPYEDQEFGPAIDVPDALQSVVCELEARDIMEFEAWGKANGL